ncbi:hypothetical protein GE061_002850 [Apolygus lucorum]|uniref:DUF8207 domain-containing protein n=1 Tax=Apolygus lucorum TaxID=248454 RepID=A0A8S9X835_APOLU|nr:hypothetical protein GE061_002850 [Apolygus lucorum]
MSKYLDELLRAKTALRAKYRQISQGAIAQESFLKSTFEPITRPLNTLIERSGEFKDIEQPTPIRTKKRVKGVKTKKKRKQRIVTPLVSIKNEPVSAPEFLTENDFYEYEPQENDQEVTFDPPKTSSTPNKDPFSSSILNQTTVDVARTHTPKFATPQMGEKNIADLETTAIREQAKTPQGQKDMQEILSQFPLHAQKYIAYLTLGAADSGIDENTLDAHYGPRVAGTSGVNLGSKNIKFEGNYVYLGDNLKARGTKGFYDLLFLKDPKNYTQSDLANYEEFIRKSNVAYSGYSPFRQINRYGGSKYAKFIKNIYPPKGKGEVELPAVQLARDFDINSVVGQIYDPNVLVNGLKVYLSSYNAGNLNLYATIDAVIRRLKNLGYIQG